MVPEEELPPAHYRIVHSELVTTVVHAGDTVLVDMGSGRRLTLNSFGARVWALLEERPTLPMLLSRLDHDETSVEHLSDDVAEMIARWRVIGVITWRDEPDTAPAPPRPA